MQREDNIASSTGFRFGITECRYFPKRLHHLPQMELVYINKGEGLCFAGDGITSFRPGELFFFSTNIPHHFKSAAQFYEPNYPLRCGSTYLLFGDGVLPSNYRSMDECANIGRLIRSAEQGLKWSVKAIDRVMIKQIEEMELLHGFERMMRLYEVLNYLGQRVDEGETIASQKSSKARESGDKAYRDVVEYITHNFHRNITLDELADHTEMNRTALCRHFKSRADRSIFDFLLEFRIKHAQQLLLTTHQPIAEVAQGSGFNNLPNFNVQFKSISGCTPGEYRLRR